MKNRATFGTVRYNADVLYPLTKTADEYSNLLKEYLTSCGWTEEEFEKELIGRSERKLS